MEYNVTDSNFVVGAANPPPIENSVQRDRITQIGKPQTDILWMIDNSCSMEEEQLELTNNFDAFINYFIDSGLDWHVGVVSTDMSRNDHKGKLQTAFGYTYIDEHTPDPVIVFRQMASMGTSGSGAEKGLASIYTALEQHRDGANKGFYREDGLLSIIVISDEHDQSYEISLVEFISWLTNMKEDVDDVTFSSIVCLEVGTLNGQQCGTGFFTEMTVGEEYMAVTDAVGGVLWDIRRTNWSEVLNELGILASGLKREFFLSDIPVPETLEVWVEIDHDTDEDATVYNFQQDIDYVYSPTRNSIQFHTYVPSQYSRIFIEYTLLASYNESKTETILGDD